MFRASLLSVSSLVLAAAIFGANQLPSPASAQSQPQPNTLAGKRLFLRCASCHAIAPGAAARIGPNLQGVVGRKAGSVPGFKYSSAMSAANLTWTPENLDRWLTKPNAVVPGTAMAFAGLPDPKDRKALIAYLAHPGN